MARFTRTTTITIRMEQLHQHPTRTISILWSTRNLYRQYQHILNRQRKVTSYHLQRILQLLLSILVCMKTQKSTILCNLYQRIIILSNNVALLFILHRQIPLTIQPLNQNLYLDLHLHLHAIEILDHHHKILDLK